MFSFNLANHFPELLGLPKSVHQNEFPNVIPFKSFPLISPCSSFH